MLNKKALAGTAGAPKLYVEDVMSCFLYTGNGSTQTITNNIDLSTEGGLVWTKNRDTAGTNHILCDTGRGITNYINSNNTNGQNANGSLTDVLTATTSTGYSLGADATLSAVNVNAKTYVSWTFRKAKKFFDVVTFTTTTEPTSPRTVSHNLGSTPGFVLLKNTTSGADWYCYHRSLGDNSYLVLNATQASSSLTGAWSVSSTNITIKENFLAANSTFVAYLFAHDAGGFGDAGSDNVISCGSFTTSGTGEATVTLNYEPQWLLLKPSSTTGNWLMVDTMRGWNVNATGNIQRLRANLSDAEDLGGQLNPTSTGFKTSQSGALAASTTYIYIAIRRGPMKTPTSGTSVFTPVSTSGDVSEITAGFPVDLALGKEVKNSTSYGNYAIDRLRGGSVLLETNTTGADITSQTFKFDSNTKFLQSGGGLFYGPSIYWLMRRAPGFFDVVCYTGTGSQRTVSHNLGVAPELIIVKSRNDANDWAVYSSAIGNTKNLRLNTTAAESSALDLWASTTPSATTFTVTGTFNIVNGSTVTYVAYLFASLSGVSKVGSYTGNGSSVTVTTGFQPRFIMVKRTDSTGNWIVGDSARGLPTGNDPALFLNSTAAETTGQDWVDVSSTGFTVNETALNANVNTATYLYLAVA